jgi:hypothetical protein
LRGLQASGDVVGIALNFCSCTGIAHFCTDVRGESVLDFAKPSKGMLQDTEFSNPEFFEMIIEFLGGLFMIQLVSILSRLIRRRRDVFYYISMSDPHRNAL